MSMLLFWGNLASIGVNVVLLVIAVLMGRKFSELQATGAIIGAESNFSSNSDDRGASELKSLASNTSDADDDDSAP